MPIHDNKGRNPVPELGDTSGYYPDGKPPEPTQAEIEAFKAAMTEEVMSKVAAVEKDGNESRKRILREMARKLQRVESLHSFEVEEKKVDGVRRGGYALAIGIDPPILPASVKAIGETDGIIETRKRVAPGEDPGLDDHAPVPGDILIIEVESSDADPLQAKHIKGAGPANPAAPPADSGILVVPVAHAETPDPQSHVTVSHESRGGDSDLSRGSDSRKGGTGEPIPEATPVPTADHGFFVPAHSKIKPFFRKSETESRIPEGNPYAFPLPPVSRTAETPDGIPPVHGKATVFTDAVGGKPAIRQSESAPLEVPVSEAGEAFFARYGSPVPAQDPAGIAIREATVPRFTDRETVPGALVVPVHDAAVARTEGNPELPEIPAQPVIDGGPLADPVPVIANPVRPPIETGIRTVDHERVTRDPVYVPVHDLRPEGIPSREMPLAPHGEGSLDLVPVARAEGIEGTESHIRLKPIEHTDHPSLEVPQTAFVPVEHREIQADDPGQVVDGNGGVPDAVHQSLVFQEIQVPGSIESAVTENPDHRPGERLVVKAEAGPGSLGTDQHRQTPVFGDSDDGDFRIGKADRKRAVESEDGSDPVTDPLMQAGALYRLHAGEVPVQAAFHHHESVQQGHSTPLTQEVVSMVDRMLVTADSGSYVKEVRMTLNDSVLPNTEIQFRQVGTSLTVTLFNEDGASLELLRKEAPELAEALRARTGDDVEVRIVTGTGAGASEETV